VASAACEKDNTILHLYFPSPSGPADPSLSFCAALPCVDCTNSSQLRIQQSESEYIVVLFCLKVKSFGKSHLQMRSSGAALRVVPPFILSFHPSFLPSVPQSNVM
jgi:hypothetical protein